jgi:hypothetical protein
VCDTCAGHLLVLAGPLTSSAGFYVVGDELPRVLRWKQIRWSSWLVLVGRDLGWGLRENERGRNVYM